MSFTYSFDRHMDQYKTLFNTLIHEKKGMDPNLLDQKIEKAREQAKVLFLINGSSEFKEMTSELLRKLCEVKPGRKLMKILFKNLTEKQIIIFENDKSQYNPITNTIGFKKTPTKYYALQGNNIVNAEKPLEVSLAHEIIHAMQKNCDVGVDERHEKNTLPEMSNSHEQLTIIGFDSNYTCIKSSLDKYDLICENAFLLAWNLLPRINHDGPDDKAVCVINRCNANDGLNNYYKWMEETLRKITELPEDKKDDREYILDFIKRNPIAITSVPEKLKIEVLLEAIDTNIDIMNYFPDLKSDKNFLKKAIFINPDAFLYSSSALLKDSDFVLEALRIIIVASTRRFGESEKNKDVTAEAIEGTNVIASKYYSS